MRQGELFPERWPSKEVFSMKRWRMSSGKSKREFRKSASRVHGKNALQTSAPMRGGIRL